MLPLLFLLKIFVSFPNNLIYYACQFKHGHVSMKNLFSFFCTYLVATICYANSPLPIPNHGLINPLEKLKIHVPQLPLHLPGYSVNCDLFATSKNLPMFFSVAGYGISWGDISLNGGLVEDGTQGIAKLHLGTNKYQMTISTESSRDGAFLVFSNQSDKAKVIITNCFFSKQNRN